MTTHVEFQYSPNDLCEAYVKFYPADTDTAEDFIRVNLVIFEDKSYSSSRSFHYRFKPFSHDLMPSHDATVFPQHITLAASVLGKAPEAINVNNGRFVESMLPSPGNPYKFKDVNNNDFEVRIDRALGLLAGTAPYNALASMNMLAWVTGLFNLADPPEPMNLVQVPAGDWSL